MAKMSRKGTLGSPFLPFDVIEPQALAADQRERGDALSQMSQLIAAFYACAATDNFNRIFEVRAILSNLDSILTRTDNVPTLDQAVKAAIDNYELPIHDASLYGVMLHRFISDNKLNPINQLKINPKWTNDLTISRTSAENSRMKGFGIRSKSINNEPYYKDVLSTVNVATTLEQDYNLLKHFFDANGIPESERAAHVVIFKHSIGFRIKDKPKWSDKNNADTLKKLYAPAFLKMVHADVIFRNHVYKETVRAYDPALMTAVEGYISQRERRNSDLGDAADLVFVASKPATNKADRAPERPKRRGLTEQEARKGPA